MMNHNNATVKCGEDTCGIAAGFNKQKWLRIVLGTEIRRAEIRSSYGEGKIDKNGIYTSLDDWKNKVREDSKNIHHFYLVPLLGLLRTKLQKK